MHLRTRMTRLLAPTLAFSLLLAGCGGGLSAREKGAITGGGIGAATGAIIGGDATGAVVGGAVGAAGGVLVGPSIFKDDPKK